MTNHVTKAEVDALAKLQVPFDSTMENHFPASLGPKPNLSAVSRCFRDGLLHAVCQPVRHDLAIVPFVADVCSMGLRLPYLGHISKI